MTGDAGEIAGRASGLDTPSRPAKRSNSINRLARRDIDGIIDRIAGNKFLPPGIREDIVERTDGIPLFIEEMTKAVLEAESEEQALRTTTAIPSPRLEIPASLHASLMARLDRLGPAKEVAQIGAMIGREFSHAVLASVVRKTEAELGLSLDRLIESGLLFRQGLPPHANYLFKHALVQNAAYGTLLRESRRALHARIAQTLVDQFNEIAQANPELVAHHYSEAGMPGPATIYWQRAGETAVERSARRWGICRLVSRSWPGSPTRPSEQSRNWHYIGCLAKPALPREATRLLKQRLHSAARVNCAQPSTTA